MRPDFKMGIKRSYLYREDLKMRPYCRLNASHLITSWRSIIKSFSAFSCFESEVQLGLAGCGIRTSSFGSFFNSVSRLLPFLETNRVRIIFLLVFTHVRCAPLSPYPDRPTSPIIVSTNSFLASSALICWRTAALDRASAAPSIAQSPAMEIAPCVT